MKLIILLLLSISLQAIQAQSVLSIANHYSSKPQTILAIAKTESSLRDEMVGSNGKDLGIMQVQANTARFIAGKDKRLAFIKGCTDSQLRYILLKNPYINIVVASMYFEYLQKRYGYQKSISKYNGCQTDSYLNKVKRNMK